MNTHRTLSIITGLLLALLMVGCSAKRPDTLALINWSNQHAALVQSEVLNRPTDKAIRFGEAWLALMEKQVAEPRPSGGSFGADRAACIDRDLRHIKEFNELLKFWGFEHLVREPVGLPEDKLLDM